MDFTARDSGKFNTVSGNCTARYQFNICKMCIRDRYFLICIGDPEVASSIPCPLIDSLCRPLKVFAFLFYTDCVYL